MTAKFNEECASVFIASTCQLLIRRSSRIYSDHMHDLMVPTGPRASDLSFLACEEYSVICGSHAEFYIQPLITCIDDLDQLVALNNELAFSGDFPMLPSDMSGLAHTIKCFKIEPYDIYNMYPGYVRIRVFGEMNYNWKSKIYEFNQAAAVNEYFIIDLDILADSYYRTTVNRKTLLSIISGPAVKQRGGTHTENCFGDDFVRSIWCPQWPKEANGWLKRSRKNGWPTTDVISDVFQNGCHLVYVKHRSCRDGKEQWRFSFSWTEVILLQSWTQTQQIVYHLIRFFAKRELIQKGCPKEDEVLCTYHLKTMMLWACEDMPPEWWNSASIITICSELLKKLSEWLKNRHCPNYFIPEANLFQYQTISETLEKVVRQLNIFSNPEILCKWFVEHYIQYFIGRFWTMENTTHFVYFMPSLIEFWKSSEFKSLEFYFSKTFVYSHTNCRSAVKVGAHSGLRNGLMSQNICRSIELKTEGTPLNLPTIQKVSCFTYQDNLLYILHTAYGLGCGEIAWYGCLFVEFVIAISMQPKITRSKYHNFPIACTAQSSQFDFLRSQNLMEQLTGANSRSEFQLLSLMTKQFLNKALEHYDNESVSAALAYLAALHFATSEYQEATRLCLAVLWDKTSQEDTETLNAGCLFFIDDIAKIAGLCVLKKKITENNLHYINRRLYLDLRFSANMFAHYLSILSAERMSKQSDFYNNLPYSSFPMDVNLKALLKLKFAPTKSISDYYAVRQIAYSRPGSVTKKASRMNLSIVKDRIIDVLMEYALENVTSFYDRIRKDFGVICNTAVCYKALHLYNYRKYDEVLHLCERILQESDLLSDLKEFSFANVLLLPPFDSFFDRDVQSLLGFHTLFHLLSPLNDHMGQIDTNKESTFEHWFARCVYFYKKDLVVAFQFRYSIKCHYFLGRHFLARYLKLRCCIDCNLPYSDALDEFAAHNNNLPLEHIISRFILRKFRI